VIGLGALLGACLLAFWTYRVVKAAHRRVVAHEEFLRVMEKSPFTIDDIDMLANQWKVQHRCTSACRYCATEPS
jgi:hypothetical protein